MNVDELRARATSQGDRTIAISRVFDATPEKVFAAWTDPEKWARWFAPAPVTAPRVETDPRPGGRYTFVMRDPEGNEFESTGEYLEVAEPVRIVYLDSSSAMPARWTDLVNQFRGEPPGTPVPDGVGTVTFEDVDGGTRMTFSEEFDTPALRDAFVQMQMVEGLSQGFDQLEQVLASGD